MLLIHPPVAKPCEPPAGISRLAGVLRGHGLPCTLLDANLEAFYFLISSPMTPNDTWSRRACRNLTDNLDAIKTAATYENMDRYKRAVADVNRVLEKSGLARDLSLSLANFQEHSLSPLRSNDLLRSAERPEENIYYNYFANRLPQIIAEDQPTMIGFSLNYLNQAVCTFAMAGFIKKHAPSLPIVMGGGLITSWLRNPDWRNPFAGLVDHLVAGPGEAPLLKLLGSEVENRHHLPLFDDLPLADYLAPGFILPYAASSGCYWSRCSFCPEKAEKNPFLPMPADLVLDDIHRLTALHGPVLLHLLDNAVNPALMQELIARPNGVNWYGFARISPRLTDVDFCRSLRRSGCVMLKLGIESGDQGVLDAMNKGIDLREVSLALTALKAAGIATYVYLLFGTPTESLTEARRTMNFVVRHSEAITFLNLAVFNMPVCSQEAQTLAVNDFYQGDLTLYTDFVHPRGWHRREVRQFLDHEFKHHPAIRAILQRDPPHFTSNHAPFFVKKRVITGTRQKNYGKWQMANGKSKI